MTPTKIQIRDQVTKLLDLKPRVRRLTASGDDNHKHLDAQVNVLRDDIREIGRLTGTVEPLDAEEAADGGDAGAVMFAGALLAAHLDHLKKIEAAHQSTQEGK